MDRRNCLPACQATGRAVSAKEVFKVRVRLFWILIWRLLHAEQLREATETPSVTVSLRCCCMSWIAHSTVHAMALPSMTNEREHELNPFLRAKTVVHEHLP